jgi:hypothetical protein
MDRPHRIGLREGERGSRKRGTGEMKEAAAREIHGLTLVVGWVERIRAFTPVFAGYAKPIGGG